MTMTPDLLLETSRGDGPLGTGVHLLRRAREGPSGPTVADAWLTVLFVPIVPLGAWSVQPSDASPPALRVTRVAPARALKSLAWIAAGVLAVVLALLPAYAAITLFMGSKPVELGGLFASAGAIVGVLAWLDLPRDRVPLAAALQVVRRARNAPAPEAGR